MKNWILYLLSLVYYKVALLENESNSEEIQKILELIREARNEMKNL